MQSSTPNPTAITSVASYPKLLRMKEVLQRIPVSKSQIYRMIEDGTFVKKIHIGKSAVAFTEQSVNEWIFAQIEKQAASEAAK